MNCIITKLKCQLSTFCSTVMFGTFSIQLKYKEDDLNTADHIANCRNVRIQLHWELNLYPQHRWCHNMITDLCGAKSTGSLTRSELNAYLL